MKKHNIKSVMVTNIYLRREKLITKETMEIICKKGVKGNELFLPKKDSVNDDLESFFANIRLGNQLDEKVSTYFLPKLTKEELKLVERRSYSYFVTFFEQSTHWNQTNGFIATDVDETEMMLSESDSKYIYAWSNRRTFVIENSSENNCSSSSTIIAQSSSNWLTSEPWFKHLKVRSP